MEYVDPALDERYAQQEVIPAQDYRFFQYSKLALPLLLFTLGIFIALLLLTMWQSNSDIRGMRAGTPRDVQTIAMSESTTEAGVMKHKQGVRYALSFLGIFFVAVTLIVYMLDISPVLRARLNYPLGLLLIICGILALVAFGLDVNSERDVLKCLVRPNQSDQCESREDLGTGATVFDALSAIFLITSGILVIAYTYHGDWCREKSEISEEEFYGYGNIKPGLQRNGISTVRRTITLFALVAALLSLIILLIFTLLIHEQRQHYEFRDANNRNMQDNATSTRSGWPVKNTKLRYAACAFPIVTILFNMIPLTSRVIAYVLGFLYVVYAVVAFATFGVDVDAITNAKKLLCPTSLKCVYNAYNATIVLDFIGGLLLLIYVIWEYFVSKRQKKSDAPPVVIA
eukprot:NODE_2301_length_1453_cov_312.056391_g2186_i0.p1 GENE.NODE_2301_length_1453_cov_312.056391_g2186_i0~~NODE_2301_length_1453_cov_312.056391_g2186_i0.p1  ORF type:complete len:419 (-),score=105.14 NODE_2301_length_1453_cov_312.056391_g2186_i0:197-1396(-)